VSDALASNVALFLPFAALTRAQLARFPNKFGAARNLGVMHTGGLLSGWIGDDSVDRRGLVMQAWA
jgi:hypothetical protein